MSYRRLLRLAAVPVTNRRWAAPLSAIALGFGLFVGVAIGPGASGTLATGASQIIEIPGFSGGTEEEEVGGGGSGGSSATASAPVRPSATPTPEASFSEPSSTASAETESPTPSAPSHTEPGSEPAPEGEEEEATELQTLTGVVVHLNPAAGSYALAEQGGTLNAVHSGKPPAPGTRVKVPVRLLANGTFAEAGERLRTGSRERATLSGIVTYLDPTSTAPVYAVSKRGVSVLVHVRPDPAGAAADLPALGALAGVTVEIESPPAAAPSEPIQPPTVPPAEAAPPPTSCAPDPALPPPTRFAPATVLWQQELSADGAPFTYGDFEGIVAAVCPETGQLAISADDIRQAGRDLVFAVPEGLETAGLEIGQSVAATATIGEDGSLALTGLASDERLKGADDAKATRGDLAVTGVGK